MKPDMSPEAVTSRLRAVGELRRLCLSLKRVQEPARYEMRSGRTVSGEPAESRPEPPEPRMGGENAHERE